MRACTIAARRAEAVAQIGVGQEPFQRRAQRSRVARRHDDPRLPVDDDVEDRVLDVVIGVLVVSETLGQTLLDKRISLRRDRVRASRSAPALPGRSSA